MNDHTESIQVEFDPLKVSYEALLSVFWSEHMPTASQRSRQYMNAVWFHSEAQQAAIKLSMERLQKQLGSRPVLTFVGTAGVFTPAENYHQKYELRCNDKLCASLKMSDTGLLYSPIATKVNGYCGGNGSLEMLMSEIDTFELAPAARDLLIALVERKSPSGAKCGLKK